MAKLAIFLMLVIIAGFIITDHITDAARPQKNNAIQLAEAILRIIQNSLNGPPPKPKWWP